VVVGADTVVVAGEAVFGKPGDDDEARTMLRALSARTHRVFTGVVVARLGTVQHELAVVTDVTMVDLDASLVEWYVGTGEWRGKAGGYAIQGCGGALVRAVQGSVSSVVGLPVAELADVLRLSGGR
jgi:septum formation protein